MLFRRTTDHPSDRALTLNQVAVGRDCCIQELNGPGCQRLRDLGFTETLRIRKLAGGRNLICSVCGTRLAISRELAQQVIVVPVA